MPKHAPLARGISLTHPDTLQRHRFGAGTTETPGWAYEQIKDNPVLFPDEPVEVDDTEYESIVEESKPAYPSYPLEKPLDQHTKDELVGICEDLKLSHSGNKGDLIERIGAHLGLDG
jgi:hypothetical protein